MNMMTRLEPRLAPPSNDAARRSIRFRKLVSLFEKDEIEAGVDALIAYLDAQAGDPDIEPNGDELDGCGSEEGFHRQSANGRGPGCPLSDPGGCEHDGREPEDDDGETEDEDKEDDGVAARRPHRDRIRRTRCDRTVWRGAYPGAREYVDYRLRRA